MNGLFTCLCFEYFTLDTYDVAYVKLLEICVWFFTNAVSCYINLNIARLILHVTEGCLTHNTLRHHTSCDGNGLAL